MTRLVRGSGTRGALVLLAMSPVVWGLTPAAAQAAPSEASARVETSQPAGSFAGGWVGTIDVTEYSFYRHEDYTVEWSRETTFTLDGKQDSERTSRQWAWYHGAKISSTYKQTQADGTCTYTEKGHRDWSQKDGAVNVLFSTAATDYQVNAGANKLVKTKWKKVCPNFTDSGTSQVNAGGGSIQVGTAMFSGGQLILSGSEQTETPTGYTLVEWNLSRRPVLELVGVFDYYGSRTIQIDVAGNDSAEAIMDADMWSRYPGAYLTIWSIWTGTLNREAGATVEMFWNDHYGLEDEPGETWDIRSQYEGPDTYEETVRIIRYGQPDTGYLDAYRTLKIHGPGTMASVEHWMAVRLHDQAGQVILGSVTTAPDNSDDLEIELTGSKRKKLYWS